MHGLYKEENEMSDINELEKLARQWLVDRLREGEVKVSFTKKDGSQREMTCTLKEGVVVPHISKTGVAKKHSDDVLPVWDVELGEWRSFKYDTLTTIVVSDRIDSYPEIWEDKVTSAAWPFPTWRP